MIFRWSGWPFEVLQKYLLYQRWHQISWPLRPFPIPCVYDFIILRWKKLKEKKIPRTTKVLPKSLIQSYNCHWEPMFFLFPFNFNPNAWDAGMLDPWNFFRAPCALSLLRVMHWLELLFSWECFPEQNKMQVPTTIYRWTKEHKRPGGIFLSVSKNIPLKGNRDSMSGICTQSHPSLPAD
jgi:hypothetical protein